MDVPSAIPFFTCLRYKSGFWAIVRFGVPGIAGAGAKGFPSANMRWGHGWLVLAASVFVCAGMRAAAPLPWVQGFARIWELSVDGINRKCRQIATPRAFLSAFPVLALVDAWSLTGGDRLEFSRRTGKTVLEFAATAGAAFAPGGPKSEAFRLAAIDEAAQTNESFAKQGATPAPAVLAAKQVSPAGGASRRGRAATPSCATAARIPDAC